MAGSKYLLTVTTSFNEPPIVLGCGSIREARAYVDAMPNIAYWQCHSVQWINVGGRYIRDCIGCKNGPSGVFKRWYKTGKRV
jgi:hypothetical protein